MSERVDASKRFKSESDHLLIVEGVQDCHVFFQIADRHGLANSFGIWDGESDQGALKRFGGLLASSKRPSILGIVLDCDGDEDGKGAGVARRWAQVCGKLNAYEYHLPVEPSSEGTIFDGPEGYPRIGVWLMPNNQSEGMLEDFLLALIPDQSKQFADQAATAAKLRGFGNYREVHHSKAVAHTFLAWQDVPGSPLGSAIRARSFDVNVDSPFVKWLKALFSPVAA